MYKKGKEVTRLSEKRIEIAKDCGDEGLKGIDVPRYKIYQAYLYKMMHDLESARTRLKQEKENVTAKKAILVTGVTVNVPMLLPTPEMATAV